MFSLECVPCQEVNLKNEKQIWPTLLKSLRECNFAALDFEFSGIGDKCIFKIGNVDDRYNAIANAAKSRAILSFGISFFKHSVIKESNGEKEDNALTYVVHTYNILTSCVDEYVKEDDAVQFLISHGFDFDRQVSEGLQYYKGNDRNDTAEAYNSVRLFFGELIKRKIPIVVHNGFLDLIYLYQNFYCNLPNTLQTFLCDLKEMFPTGIYDTKYIAEFEDRLNSSFLEYVFHEKQIRNFERKVSGKAFIDLMFQVAEGDPQYCQIGNLKTIIGAEKPEGVIICKNYMYHGWCKKGTCCPHSHDIHLILSEVKRSKKKKKKQFKARENGNTKKEIKSDDIPIEKESEKLEASKEESTEKTINPENIKNGLHSSGFDAFMTGYCFAVNHSIHGETNGDTNAKFSISKVKRFACKLYLSGKEQPLKVVPSSFSKPSVNHKAKLSRIMKSESLLKTLTATASCY